MVVRFALESYGVELGDTIASKLTRDLVEESVTPNLLPSYPGPDVTIRPWNGPRPGSGCFVM
jgi:hypothetical protein